MAVTARSSENAFAPYRGTEAQISAFPVKNGALYFAYDTNKIFFDDANGNRHTMSGSGIKFVYGHCIEDLIATNDSDGLLPYPREDIALAYYELNRPVETYQTEDIIINHDGTLYRIKRIDDTYCYCEKLLVSGSGGGSGSDSSGVTLYVTKDPAALLAKGGGASLTVRITDTKTKQNNNGTVYVEFFASDTALEPFREPIVLTGRPVNQGEIVINIPGSYLRVGINQLKLYAVVNGRRSDNGDDQQKEWRTIQVVDIHLVPNETMWNPIEFKSSSNLVDFIFPYRVTYDTSMTKENFMDLLMVDGQPTTHVTAIIDANNTALKTTEDVVDDIGYIPLANLFADASHGNHTLDIIATMEINGVEVTITDNLHYEIGWFIPTETKTIIWSPFPHETEFENYTLIDIPFMVMNPEKTDSTTVTFYINDEEISSTTVEYNPNSYDHWEVSNYKLGTNTFTIVSGQASWQTIVNITANINYSLEPIAGAVLELNAAGRSNNESPVKRSQWKNIATVQSNKVLKTVDTSTNPPTYTPANVELRGFNWYNNGWLKDDENNSCLRVSNGASVYIPISVFNNSVGTNQTYEFEFAVHNATDYSRLIKTETVYLTYAQLTEIDPDTNERKYKWFDSDLRQAFPYDESQYHADDQGMARDENNNLVPQENPLTGDEVLQRTTSTSGRGTFLQYYASNKGIILGTQEAFLALSQALLVNARYTDDARVKISFVVSTNPQFKMADGTVKSLGKPAIFAYINGVITNILPYPASTSFSQSFAANSVESGMQREGIYIYSDYCDIDIYNIRIYENDLPFSGITQNWTADGPTLKIKKDRYEFNQGILDANQNYIDYLKTKASKRIPVMVIQTEKLDGIKKLMDELPYKKGDKYGCNIRYYDPADPEKCWHASNATMDVQGTSSQGYPRRNFQIKLKQGSADWNDENKMAEYGGPNPFRIAWWDGDEANKDIYNLNRKSAYVKYKPNSKDSNKNKGTIKIGTFGMENKSLVLKADYMDSSSSHNTPGANLVDYLAGNYSQAGYDLRHPLKRLDPTGAKENYRTTVYGFPILLFWENKDGDITFVGRYNLNTHKECENTFGFTYAEKDNPNFDSTQEESDDNPKTIPAVHPYLHELTRPVVNDDEEDPNFKDNMKTGTLETIEDPTFEDVCECWEFRQNQAGHGKFQDDSVEDNWLQTGTTTVNNQEVTYFEISEHFEQRYPEMVGTGVVSGKDGDGNEFEWRHRPENLHRLWDWIRQTDVTSYIGRKGSQPVRDIGTKYYRTLSTAYEPGVHYYTYDSANDEYNEAVITVQNTVTKTGAYTTSHLRLDDNGNVLDTNHKDSQAITFEVIDQTKIWAFVKSLETDGLTHADSEYVGEQSFVRQNIAEEGDPADYRWFYGNTEVNLIEDIGVNLVDDHGLGINYITLNLAVVITGFNTSLYERFTVDNDRYRLAKFKNEFTEHLNMAYTLFYFVYTEFFLLYDSRQKNMMIASWGPEREGGDYIWYPIFYDLDTQLGINNSGQIYWDYDVDATPPLTTRTVFNNGVADVEIYSATGSTDSIFSGNGSVLWNNVQLCFSREIANLYKAIRESFNQAAVTKYYETDSSDKWSESMKNYDAFYKYISPAIPGIGYTDPDHNNVVTSDYFYCLQGDRSLQRKSLVRNRFNYIDSNWSAAAYDPVNTSSQIKMRYNLNDKDRTSDQNTPATEQFDANATFTIKPYLSQYVSVLYDQTSSTVKKFSLGGASDNVVIDPPTSIGKRAALGVALTQQLAYIRGPQYVSSIGDLAPKYLNEFVLGPADRLRELKVGDDRVGYRNENLTSLTIGPKGLLRMVDLSNLSQLTGDPEIDQCPKLEVLKLLGTNIAALPLPKGNVLTTVYLPKTLSEISLVTPLKLNRILTSTSQIASGNNQEGLFIENLTDMLGYLNEEYIPDNINSNIELYQMDDTKLGYGTYSMLSYLYKLKRERFLSAESHSNTSPNLKIQVLNANWTPYQQVGSDEAYDSTQTSNYYYRDYIQYYRYTYTSASQWQKDTLNGIVYLYDTSMGASPITNLAMFKQFIDDKNASGTIDNYQFQPLKGDVQNAQKRIIPTITGHLHVSNTAQTPINEAEVFAYYQKEGNFTDLDITADYVTEANRARFIEYAEDGSVKELYCQKYFEGVPGVSPQITFGADRPTRLHYDFLGWVEMVNDDPYDWEANRSIRNEWKNDDNECVNLNDYSLTAGSHTFIAVFSIHGYTVSYYMDDGSPVRTWDELNQVESPQVTSVAVSGSPVVFTQVVPWKDDSQLALKQTYRFKGWKLSLDPTDTKIYNNTTSRLTIDRDTAVYAVFAEESVYDSPLTAEELIVTVTGAETVSVTVPVGRGLRGKICIPSTISYSPSGGTPSTYKVTGLLGAGIEDDSAYLRGASDIDDGGNLSHLTRLTAVFFEGCSGKSGAVDYITDLPEYCFCGDTSLVYVDIPDSLQRIMRNAFQGDPLSTAMNNTKHVYSLGGVVFYDAYSGTAGQDDNFTLYLGKEVIAGSANNDIGNLGGNCFDNASGISYIKNIVIGSAQSPVTRIYCSRTSQDVFAPNIQSIIVYVTSDVDREILGNLLSSFCVAGAAPSIDFR